jgi:hypothetical protein
MVTFKENYFSRDTPQVILVPNDTDFEFLLCEGTEKKGGHTHRRNKDNIYIDYKIHVRLK